MVENLVEEVLRMDALALKPALHIGDGNGNSVDPSGFHLGSQLLDGV
jgi:hypothetical protein